VKAVVYGRHGGPDVLELVELPDPTPGPGEVLLRVLATSINRLDLDQRRGPAFMPGHELPHIAGMDVCGEVVDRGPGGDDLAVGDLVVVNPKITCGVCHECRRGRDSRCPHRRVVGASRAGGYAELCAVPAGQLFPLPPGYSPLDAGALPTAHSLAWRGLFGVGGLRAGETVLVNAAGSGVSCAAIQLAAIAGARVIVAARSADRLVAAEKLGADVAVDTSDLDLVETVRDVTGGTGADLVFDHVGAPTFASLLRCVAAGGRLVTCGATAPGPIELHPVQLFRTGISLRGVDGYSAIEFADMIAFCFRHRLQPAIDSVVGLDGIAAAHARFEAGGVVGKVMVQP
jgi:NADPH:quinone reductase-like Zn-dependent oxidoreductase